MSFAMPMVSVCRTRRRRAKEEEEEENTHADDSGQIDQNHSLETGTANRKGNDLKTRFFLLR